jgi:hypothetical protein
MLTSETMQKLTKGCAETIAPTPPLAFRRDTRESFLETKMRAVIKEEGDRLPHPGKGQTLRRWQALAEAGAGDLSFAKIFESHTDALAILLELNGHAEDDALCAVWAAEPPGEALELETGNRLIGRKSWCSAAGFVDIALVTVRRGGERLLAKVDLRQFGITVDLANWKAVGMRDTQSGVVTFDGVAAEIIGEDGSYTDRPGFWQGGAGIAAVWFGAACAIGERLSRSTAIHRDPHAAAHLGAMDVALSSAKAVLESAAAWIDAQPAADALTVALRARAAVEAAANEVLLRTGRALGPGPMCMDSIHAQRCVDLEVFLRQSHAERDLELLGRSVAGQTPWRL